jgi:hypothetical protein
MCATGNSLHALPFSLKFIIHVYLNTAFKAQINRGKLIVTQLVKTIPRFHGARRFIVVSTRARHCPPPAVFL